MPSALLSHILLAQAVRQKQVVAGDRGRWAMKYFLTTIVSWGLAFSCLYADTTEATICIQVGDAGSSEPIYVNNKRWNIESAREWLSSVKSKFGDDDPVLLICRSDTPVGLISDLRSMITATHKKLFIVIADDRNKISSQMTFGPPSEEVIKLFSGISVLHNTLWDDVLRKNE